MDWIRGHAIGRGSSATVSVATSRRSGDIFAAKSVELSQSEFLQREQKILSSLSCPHIVSYMGYDISRENNKLMYNLLMEYVPGGTLTDAIHQQGGRLGESVIGCYTRQIVEGLEYLHSSGVVHCDIKGRNILVGESGAKIADLGCAKWVHPVVAGGGSGREVVAAPIGGTPVFMAPEVARGEEQGFPVDIWALGCTVIEMATGGLPWPNVTDPVSILYRIAFSGELPEYPNFLSDQAKDFLSKCLRRDPKERWTAKQLLKHPFLGEFISPPKQSPDFDSNSPTSILDQGIWNSTEESEFLGDLVHTGSLNSPAQRIRRLSLCSGVPSWTLDDDWITIRGNNGEEGEETDTVCGSVTALISHDMELEDTVSLEDLVYFLDSNVSCSNSSSNNFMASICTEHSVVMSSLNFQRDKGKLLLIQSQFL